VVQAACIISLLRNLGCAYALSLYSHLGDSALVVLPTRVTTCASLIERYVRFLLLTLFILPLSDSWLGDYLYEDDGDQTPKSHSTDSMHGVCLLIL
jgi:hypothetical protein